MLNTARKQFPLLDDRIDLHSSLPTHDSVLPSGKLAACKITETIFRAAQLRQLRPSAVNYHISSVIKQLNDVLLQLNTYTTRRVKYISIVKALFNDTPPSTPL